MQTKRLHVHSLPIVGLAIVATVLTVTVVSVSTAPSFASALISPALSVRPTDAGMAKLVPAERPVEPVDATEQPVIASDSAAVEAKLAAQHFKFVLALRQAGQ